MIKRATAFKKIPFYLILVVLGLMSISVTHADNYTIVEKWNPGEMIKAETHIVAIGPLDDIYIVTRNNILRHDTNGNTIAWWKGRARDLDVDSSGNVYVVGSSNDLVEIFDSNGYFITKWGEGQLLDPDGIALDPLGNVYVLDTFGNRIVKFDNNGNFIFKMDFIFTWKEGPAGDYASYMADIDTDLLGNLYVINNMNDSIQIFNGSGILVNEWDLFPSASYIAVDSSGNVYLANYGDTYIRKYDSNGNYITKWNYMIESNETYATPDAIAVDSLGSVYVADEQNSIFLKFTDKPQHLEQNIPEESINQTQNKTVPGFEAIYGLICLFAMFFIIRK